MDIMQAGLGPSRKYASSSSSGATATASFAAVTAQCFFLDGGRITLSSSALNSALCTIANGATTIDSFYITSGQVTPLDFGLERPMGFGVSSSCVVTVPSCGSGVVGTISLRGKYLSP